MEKKIQDVYLRLAKILGRTDCHHSLEVCIKYDELAEFVIAKGLAREISKDEAIKILAASEKEGRFTWWTIPRGR